MFFSTYSKLCDDKGISVYKAATAMGFNRSIIAKWKTGAVPNGDNLSRIADYFGVSADYLLNYGEQEKRVQGAPIISDEEQQLLRAFRKIPKASRGIVMQMVMAAAGNTIEENDQPISAPMQVEEQAKPIRYIRHYLTAAAAGYAAPIDGEDFELIPCPDDAPEAADFAVSIAGDSMEPYIHDGDTVYVQRDAVLNTFDPGIFFVDGDVYCKQYCPGYNGQMYLLSANPKREDANIILNSDSARAVVCFGKVLLDKKLPRPIYR